MLAPAGFAIAARAGLRTMVPAVQPTEAPEAPATRDRADQPAVVPGDQHTVARVARPTGGPAVPYMMDQGVPLTGAPAGLATMDPAAPATLDRAVTVVRAQQSVAARHQAHSRITARFSRENPAKLLIPLWPKMAWSGARPLIFQERP